MKSVFILWNLPELQKFEKIERRQVIREWQNELDKSWHGYLRHALFLLIVTVSIITLVVILLLGLQLSPHYDWGIAIAGPIAIFVANILYNRFVVVKHRNVLDRILQKHGKV